MIDLVFRNTTIGFKTIHSLYKAVQITLVKNSLFFLILIFKHKHSFKANVRMIRLCKIVSA